MQSLDILPPVLLIGFFLWRSLNWAGEPGANRRAHQALTIVLLGSLTLVVGARTLTLLKAPSIAFLVFTVVLLGVWATGIVRGLIALKHLAYPPVRSGRAQAVWAVGLGIVHSLVMVLAFLRPRK